MSSCWVCHGTKKCASCNGTARQLLPPPVRGSTDRSTIAIRCQGCAGTGVCPACHGSGELREAA